MSMTTTTVELTAQELVLLRCGLTWAAQHAYTAAAAAGICSPAVSSGLDAKLYRAQTVLPGGEVVSTASELARHLARWMRTYCEDLQTGDLDAWSGTDALAAHLARRLRDTGYLREDVS